MKTWAARLASDLAVVTSLPVQPQRYLLVLLVHCGLSVRII